MARLIQRAALMSFTLFLPILLHAAGGAFEINQDCAAVGCFPDDAPGLPVTIFHPGTYVLTSDLLVTQTGATAITINAAHVDLDLNNHTIDGGGSCTGIPVASCAPGAGFSGITAQGGGPPVGALRIHNGTVRGFTYSTPSFAGAGISISDAGDGTVLEHLTVVENGSNTFVSEGIFLSSNANGSVVLRNSQVARIAGNGIQINGPLAISAEYNDISGNEDSGVVGGASGSAFIGNRFNNNGGYAINGAGLVPVEGFSANTFSGNKGGGANLQYTNVTVRDMGGNVCIDHVPCP